MNNKRLTRKEVACLVGVSVYSVRKNEEAWGLNRAKVQANSRLIWYVASEAIAELRKRRLLLD